ncbi:MAG: formylmethanofuran dehydrogenase subunit B [Candidatus Bathyarchaeota archaeon]|nr:formylmethanofuran dehydrogenase subunit B [Candidatus Bathyarchaeota archaeon]
MPIISNVTCPVCGSLCDDIEVLVENNKIVKVRNACGLGESKFLNYNRHHLRKPLIRKNGELVEASTEEAIRKSAEILADAAYPILYGWSCTSCEAIRVGLELAEEVGGVVDNTSTVCHGPSVLSIQDVGYSTCTLGQIRHRADLVIYWGSNPWSAHPRHIERYTAFTQGRFQASIWYRYLAHLSAYRARRRLMRALKLSSLSEALMPAEVEHGLPPTLFRKERKMIVVDVRRTRTADIADYFLQVEPNKDYEVLQALRALIRDEEIDMNKVAGIPVETLEELADIMIGCKFGVLFFGVGLTMSMGKLRNIDTAISMVRDLNRYTKFMIMPMRGHFNVTGANVVYTWQTGYPYAVDFSHGYPRYNPGETSVVDILTRGESDASLVVASDPVAHFPKAAAENLVRNPLIVIDPEPTATSLMADVVFPSAYVGIEAEGTAYRMDHVPLPLKKIVEPPSSCLSDTEILQRILAGVRKIRKEKAEAA